MKNLYLAAAIVGAVAPWVFFTQHIMDSGFALTGFLQAVFATSAASGFAADLIVSSVVFWILMVQLRSEGGPKPVLFVILNIFVGLSCALPAYLYARERRAVRH